MGSNRTLSMPHRIWIVRVADPSNGDAIRIFGTFRQENVAWRALICLWKSHHGVEGHDPASVHVTIRELMDSGYEHLQIIANFEDQTVLEAKRMPLMVILTLVFIWAAHLAKCRR